MVKFFGYRRGWVNLAIAVVLVAMNRLSNVAIRESHYSACPVGTGKAPVAYFGPRELEPCVVFKCLEQVGGTRCAECGLCWRADRSVVFRQH